MLLSREVSAAGSGCWPGTPTDIAKMMMMMISVSTDNTTTGSDRAREPLSLRANAGSSVRADGRRRVTPELLSPAAVRPLLLRPVARPAPLTAFVDAAEARVRAGQWRREVRLHGASSSSDEEEQEQDGDQQLQQDEEQQQETAPQA